FVTLATADNTTGVDESNLWIRRRPLLGWRQGFHEELKERERVLCVEIGGLAAIVGDQLECVNTEVCFHAIPKEVTGSNHIDETELFQVRSRQESAVDRLGYVRTGNAPPLSHDLLDGLIGGLHEIFKRLTEFGGHGAVVVVFKSSFVVTDGRDEDLDAELVEE